MQAEVAFQASIITRPSQIPQNVPVTLDLPLEARMAVDSTTRHSHLVVTTSKPGRKASRWPSRDDIEVQLLSEGQISPGGTFRPHRPEKLEARSARANQVQRGPCCAAVNSVSSLCYIDP